MKQTIQAVSIFTVMAIGATLGACDYASTPAELEPAFQPHNVVTKATPYIILETEVAPSIWITRITDLETGVVCYSNSQYTGKTYSCTPDIRAQASATEEASYTVLDQEQIEWMFNGNKSQK